MTVSGTIPNAGMKVIARTGNMTREDESTLYAVKAWRTALTDEPMRHTSWFRSMEQAEKFADSLQACEDATDICIIKYIPDVK